MRENREYKKRTRIGDVGRRCLSALLSLALLLGLLTSGILIRPEETAQAADNNVWLEISGRKLDPTVPVTLDTSSITVDVRYPSMTTSISTLWTPTDLDSDNPVVEYNPTDTYCVFYAKATGSVHVDVKVTDASTGTSLLTTTMDIVVSLGIDTSSDPTVFKQVYDSDEGRCLVLNTVNVTGGVSSKQLSFNFGSTSGATWESFNEEVATVDNTGKVSAVGAGVTTILATVSQGGSTYPASIKVYVLPAASEASGGTATQDISVESGYYFYNNTDFRNSQENIDAKLQWRITQYISGSEVELVNTLTGKKSDDIITITPTGAKTNQMEVEGIAGEYMVYFYSYDNEHKADLMDTVINRTMINLTIRGGIRDKFVTLGVDDVIDLADSYNMTAEDFTSTFTVNVTTEDGGDASLYATMPNKYSVLGLGEKVVLAKMKVIAGKEAHVAELLNISVYDVKPEYVTTIDIIRGIILDSQAMEMYVGTKHQFRATLHGTSSSAGIYWYSSDDNCVTVDQSGLIEAKKETKNGPVKITASVEVGGGITRTATCSVTVLSAITKFSLDKKQIVASVGTSELISSDIPNNTAYAPLRWISSNESVFTLEPTSDNRSCIVKAVAGGTGTLIVELTLDGANVRVDVPVEVRVPYETLEFTSDVFTIPYYQNGHNMQQELKFTPNNVTSTGLKWIVTGGTAATIDSSGYLKFKTPGTVEVTVKPEYSPNGISANCTVKITGGPDNITFEGKDIKDDHMDLEVSETKSINVKFEPETAQSKLIWSCNTAGIVTTDYDDSKRVLSVIGRKVGNVTVTCRTEDNAYYSFTVTVKQASTGVQFTGDSVTLYRGDPIKGSVLLSELIKMIPETSTDKVTYASRNDKIASVDPNTGLLTAVAAGTTYVTATTTSQRTNSIDVIVIDRVTELQSAFRQATVYIGETLTITPTVVPETATNKSIKWTWEPYEQGDSASVTLVEKNDSVDVTGVNEGMVILTGVSSDNESAKVTYLLNIKYKNPQYGTVVTLSPKTKYINVGKSFRVGRKVSGAYKGNTNLKWKSSKKKVATVTNKGVVHAKKVGKATITATSLDGSGAKGKMKVVVRQLVTKLKMNRTRASIMVGGSVRLSVRVTPANATVKGVKWSSGDTSIATVDGGKVIGMAPGTVKITATSKDATKKKAYCWVTVTEPQPVTSFTVENATITVAKGKAVQAGIAPNPVNTTDSISYWSDNPSVASVNSKGKIKTHRTGQATIYARAQNGVEAHVDVTVVDLNRKAVTLRQYDTEQLSVVMISTGVSWYSADPNIASVNESGLVTARTPGSTIIYAVIDGVKLGCRVTVKRIT